MARLKADPRAQLKAEVAAGTKRRRIRRSRRSRRATRRTRTPTLGSGSGAGADDAEMADAADAEAEAAKAAANAARCDGTRSTGFYELVSVLTHKGRSADSGHYIAWVKNADGSWSGIGRSPAEPEGERSDPRAQGRRRSSHGISARVQGAKNLIRTDDSGRGKSRGLSDGAARRRRFSHERIICSSRLVHFRSTHLRVPTFGSCSLSLSLSLSFFLSLSLSFFLSLSLSLFFTRRWLWCPGRVEAMRFLARRLGRRLRFFGCPEGPVAGWTGPP